MCVCVYVPEQHSLITLAPLQIPLLSFFFHMNLISNITLHTSAVGSAIKASQISPSHTQRAILLISISNTDLPEVLHNNAQEKQPCQNQTPEVYCGFNL